MGQNLWTLATKFDLLALFPLRASVRPYRRGVRVKLELSFFVNFLTFWVGFHMDCTRNVGGLWKKAVSFNCIF